MNAEKVSITATYGGSFVAIGSGLAPTSAQATEVVLGLTIPQWQVFGVVAGTLIALVGLVAKTLIDGYFRWQEMKLARQRLEASDQKPKDPAGNDLV